MIAEEAGLSVCRSVTEGRHIGPGPFLLIEGRVCDASLSTRKVTPSPKSRAAYTYHDLRRVSKCDFVVIIQKVRLHPRRVFVVPTHGLLRHPSNRFYVPLLDVPPYRKTSRVNWKEYENAWHLLSETSDHAIRGSKAARRPGQARQLRVK